MIPNLVSDSVANSLGIVSGLSFAGNGNPAGDLWWKQTQAGEIELHWGSKPHWGNKTY